MSRSRLGAEIAFFLQFTVPAERSEARKGSARLSLIGGARATPTKLNLLILIPTYEHRLLRLVLCVIPTGGSQFRKEIDGVVPRLSPNQPLRPRKHDMRKAEFTIHSVCVARVEEGSEPIETLRGSMDELGVEFL